MAQMGMSRDFRVHVQVGSDFSAISMDKAIYLMSYNIEPTIEHQKRERVL